MVTAAVLRSSGAREDDPRQVAAPHRVRRRFGRSDLRPLGLPLEDAIIEVEDVRPERP